MEGVAFNEGLECVRLFAAQQWLATTARARAFSEERFVDHMITADYRIMLHSGRFFDLANPKPSEINVDDIAHGLAHTCRYGGQCYGFFSVAEHSVLVSKAVKHSSMAGLFHDAAEAYIGDMTAPLKRLLPEYKVIEKKIEQVIFERFDIAWPAPYEVKRADISVMAAELEVLMPPGISELLLDKNVAGARVEIKQFDPTRAKALFLERFNELIQKRQDHF